MKGEQNEKASEENALPAAQFGYGTCFGCVQQRRNYPGGTSQPSNDASQPSSDTSQPAGSSSDSSAPAPSTEGEKIIYTNGGPGEFFETPWLNPGTYMYNKTVYAHLIVADADLIPFRITPTLWLLMSTARMARR